MADRENKYFVFDGTKDVYTAAKERIHQCYDLFDNIAVSFSGGKDSLAVLRLVEEVRAERGCTDKLTVVFYDEELIPDVVIDFVRELAESGKYNFLYFAYPLKSKKYILGKTMEYIQFDPNREWVRQPPPYAIRRPEGDDRIFDQYTLGEVVETYFKGSVCLFNGIRAQESLIRLKSCAVKKHDNYICSIKGLKRMMFVKPIYDWTEDDIFIYFCKKHIKYCPIYDAQMWNGQQFRVATPLHAEAAKKLNKQKTLYASFYNKLIEVFPEMIVQAEYYSQMDKTPTNLYDGYTHNLDGLLKYIDDKLTDPNENQLAKFRCLTAFRSRQRALKGIDPNDDSRPIDFGGFPFLTLFKGVSSGAFKRTIQRVRTVTVQDAVFEGFSEEEYIRRNGNELAEGEGDGSEYVRLG